MRATRTYSGSLSKEISQREIKHRELVRKAASQGFVLMKNHGLLPIDKSAKVFLAGDGAVHPIKGGTGSGDVNEREVIDIFTGFKNAGMTVVNEAEVLDSLGDYAKARLEYREAFLSKVDTNEAGSNMDIFGVLANTKQRDYKRIPIEENEVKSADICIYTISRIAGEGRDRYAAPGDYYLSDVENEELKALSAISDKVAVLVNTGGQIEITDLVANENIKSILYISQPGMELGNAVVDVLTGLVTPSGKLTSTWAKKYEEYPNSATFSHNNGDLDNELYTEGIYVGYRYFDSFNVEPLYPFGYGLSYTNFEITDECVEKKDADLLFKAKVTNVGDRYKGAEVVQLYLSCPQDCPKELKKLVGFAKTSVLNPGQSQTVEIIVDPKSFAYFDEKKSAWVINSGEYYLLAGNSSVATKVVGLVNIGEDLVYEKTKAILPLVDELEEIVPASVFVEEQRKAMADQANAAGLCTIDYKPEPAVKTEYIVSDIELEARKTVEEFTDDELIAILMGEITKGQDNLKDNKLVETGIYVPGAAGETTCALEEKYDIPAISMADGPAGLRLMRSYDVDRESGKIYSVGLLSALEGGLFAKTFNHENVDTYYQYATAIPIGTHLAQTFDVELVKSLGELVAEEMLEFHVAWWLAPGMNIHRNPLCGRNFEYYSEDPYVAGVVAAAMTLGVQSKPGVGTTIKHFACNSQEDNRMFSNAIVSERTIREIYLRGFEIAVKTAQPMCIMTSYNKINGVPTSNSYDLCTQVARNEWGFEGIIMTDWTTTTAGASKSHLCPMAGNDLIMPGNQKDIDDIKAGFESGELTREKARECAARLVKIIKQTIGEENPKPYSKAQGMR